MKLRPLLATSVVVVIAFGAAGCNLFTPQATTIEYAPGNGISGEFGAIGVHNAMLLLSDDAEVASLIVSFSNNSTDDVQVRITVGSESQVVELTPGVTVFGVDDQLIFAGVDAEPGAQAPVMFEDAAGEQLSLDVQVFTGESPGLESLVPEAPVETPEPSLLPEPTDTAAPVPNETGTDDTGTDETDSEG